MCALFAIYSTEVSVRVAPGAALALRSEGVHCQRAVAVGIAAEVCVGDEGTWRPPNARGTKTVCHVRQSLSLHPNTDLPTSGMPSVLKISGERTPRAPRVQKIPQAPSTFSFPGPDYSMCSTPLLPTSFHRKFQSQRNVCVSNLVSSLFVYCGEITDPIENELATLVLNLRSFSQNGVESSVEP